ncbi:MAG: hypothetical protein ACUVR8_04490 [Acidobacteriota bacterium]
MSASGEVLDAKAKAVEAGTSTAAVPKNNDVSSPTASKATKSKGKKSPPLPAPVSPSPLPSAPARRNREREALNLYTTAMESFKKTDYGRARDVLQLLLSDFVLESEIADRARVFLKICEQKLQPTML